MTMTNYATTSGGKTDDRVASRIAQITSENSPIMQQARTTGLQQANRRGLSNSSMAIGASQAEAIRAAAPIASQEAALSASERDSQLAALTSLSGQRMNSTAAILQNPDIPADARNDALRSYNDQFSQIANYLQNLYGVQLNQSAPGGTPVGAAPVPGPAGAVPPAVPIGQPIAAGGSYTLPDGRVINLTGLGMGGRYG